MRINKILVNHQDLEDTIMNYDMNFEDIIKGLYSNDLYQICEILNQGKHVNELDVKDLQKALHTGFYYKIIG